MSHHLAATGYTALVERLNRFSQGAVPSESLFRILKILFSEQDAARVAQLPIRPFTARRAARIWKIGEAEAARILNDLADRAILLDLEKDGVSTYVLPPPMIGFFEFSLMRVRGDIDQKALSELLHQYVHVEDDFLMSLFISGATQVGRVFVHEPALDGGAAAVRAATGRPGPGGGATVRPVSPAALPVISRDGRDGEDLSGTFPASGSLPPPTGSSGCDYENPAPAAAAGWETAAGSLLILDYERATAVIETASHRGVSLCYCRHKMSHLGRACDAPQEICMTFNDPARALIRHGHAREVGREECLDLLRIAWEHKLVQFGSNVREGVGFICNCCGCCCEAMAAARRFGLLHPIHTTNFMPVLNGARCRGCGRCVSVCPVAALGLVAAHDPRKPKRKVAALAEALCLGCGLCVRECPHGAITLKERPRRVIPPLNAVHQAVVMAIERGKLADLIFDNHALASHRLMAAILAAILRLPPVKQLLAGKQVQSRYLAALIRRAGM